MNTLAICCRSMLVCVVVLLSWVPSTANATLHREPSVRGVRLGSSRQIVRKRLGRPRSEKPEPYDNTINDYGDMVAMDYDGLRLRLFRTASMHDYIVLSIDISDGRWVVGPGIRVNMTKAAVVRLIGEDREPSPTENGIEGDIDSFYEYPNPRSEDLRAMIVTFGRSGRVRHITLTSDFD